jgi:hypothetical protein
MLEEDEHWIQVLTDYENSPGDGIRGRGIKRRSECIAQDHNLRTLYDNFEQYMPDHYLRAISYRLRF